MGMRPQLQRNPYQPMSTNSYHAPYVPQNNSMEMSMPPIDYNVYPQQQYPSHFQTRHPLPYQFTPTCETSYNIHAQNKGMQFYQNHQQQSQYISDENNVPTQSSFNNRKYLTQHPQTKWSFKAPGSSGSLKQATVHGNFPMKRQTNPRQQIPSINNLPSNSQYPVKIQKPIGSLIKKHISKVNTSAMKAQVVKSAPLTQFPQTQFSSTQVSHKASDKSKKESTSKFLSVSIYGIRAWSQLKLSCNLVFEVFGVLDSRPCDVLSGKTFNIKDHQGRTITCIFYELDRDLPSLMRGKVYRCVGMYKSSREYLQCVSVRESDSNELQAHKRITALTCNYLRRIKSDL